jgi:hypothetical protein
VLLHKSKARLRGQSSRWGVCKKMKAHRTPPEYTITEDDADMVAQMVQDRTVEDFENVVCQRDRIEEELAYMRQLLSRSGKHRQPTTT